MNSCELPDRCKYLIRVHISQFFTHGFPSNSMILGMRGYFGCQTVCVQGCIRVKRSLLGQAFISSHGDSK